jgi:hypothetical protein
MQLMYWQIIKGRWNIWRPIDTTMAYTYGVRFRGANYKTILNKYVQYLLV